MFLENGAMVGKRSILWGHKINALFFFYEFGSYNNLFSCKISSKEFLLCLCSHSSFLLLSLF